MAPKIIIGTDTRTIGMPKHAPIPVNEITIPAPNITAPRVTSTDPPVAEPPLIPPLLLMVTKETRTYHILINLMEGFFNSYLLETTYVVWLTTPEYRDQLKSY